MEEDEEGGERPVAEPLSVLLVDLSEDALQYLAPRSPVCRALRCLSRAWLQTALQERADRSGL